MLLYNNNMLYFKVKLNFLAMCLMTCTSLPSGSPVSRFGNRTAGKRRGWDTLRGRPRKSGGGPVSRGKKIWWIVDNNKEMFCNFRTFPP